MDSKILNSAWILLPAKHMLSPNDVNAFRNIVLICMTVGLLSCIGYQVILKPPVVKLISLSPTSDIIKSSKCKSYVRLDFPYVQLWTFAYVRLLNKPYENEVTFRGQNPPLKCC